MEKTRDGNAKTVGVTRDPLQEARKHEAGGSVGGGRFYGRRKGGKKEKRFGVSAQAVAVEVEPPPPPTPPNKKEKWRGGAGDTQAASGRSVLNTTSRTNSCAGVFLFKFQFDGS